MYKILIVMVCVGVLGCEQTAKKQTNNIVWEYHLKNNSPILDHHCQSLLFQYQELLKAMKNKDSNYLKLVVNNSIRITDSLANLKMPIDSNLDRIWVEGLVNINAEFTATINNIELSDLEEIKMSVNMIGVQILNLLGQIGYKQQSIYIYKAKSNNVEDGYYWFGLQKNNKDPFETEKSRNVTAFAILQETVN